MLSPGHRLMLHGQGEAARTPASPGETEQPFPRVVLHPSCRRAAAPAGGAKYHPGEGLLCLPR